MEQNYTKIEHELPLIPLRGLAIFPYMILNFDVGREISLKALDAGALNDDLVFLTSQKEAETDEPTTDDFYHVGTICKIKQMIKLPGNTVRVLVEGISRGKIKEVGMDEEEGYFKAIIEEVAYDAENADEDAEVEAFVRNVFDAFEEYINIGNRVSPEILISLADIDNVDRFIDTIAANIYLKPDQKQSILEEFDVKKRLELIYTILLEEIEILKIEKKITLRVKKQMNKVQKEYYLREQLKAIQKELGDDEDINSEADEYREKLNKIKAPKETKEKIAKEINKFSKISPMSPDVSVSRTYLDTVFSLPWNKETRDKIDLEKAKEILDDEHYGLEKVKERILEYLAIRKLSKSLKSPIICLVGPPGVGKTSIAKSIADSLGRKFVRISLGGVRDEAEVRGRPSLDRRGRDAGHCRHRPVRTGSYRDQRRHSGGLPAGGDRRGSGDNPRHHSASPAAAQRDLGLLSGFSGQRPFHRPYDRDACGSCGGNRGRGDENVPGRGPEKGSGGHRHHGCGFYRSVLF